MSQYSENIDNFFKENLWGIKKTPSDKVWKNISANLNKKQKTRYLPIFLKYAAGVAILIALGFGAFKIINKNTADKQLVEEVYTTGNESDNIQSEIPIKTDVTMRKENKQLFVNHSANDIEENISYIIDETSSAKQYSSDITALEEEDIIKSENPEVLTMRNAVIHNSGNDSPEIDLQQKLDNIKKEEYYEGLLVDYYSSKDQSVKKESDAKWSIGGQVAPLYSHRSVSSDYYSKSVENEYKDAETGILAYAGGINVKIATGKRLSFQSGVYYSKTGQDINEWTTTTSVNTIEAGVYNYDAQFMSTQGSIDDRGTLDNILRIAGMRVANDDYNSYPPEFIQEIDISATQRLEYIEIPMYVRYKIIDRKIDFNMLGGINTNVLIGNKNIMYMYGLDQTALEQYSEITLGETQNIVNINYSGALGVGIEYPFIDKLSLSIEPIFRYSILSVYEDSRFNSHPYSFGVFTGLNYKF